MNCPKCFLICSFIILSLAGINYTLGPMVNSKKYYGVKKGDIYIHEWEYINCNKISDKIEEDEKNNLPNTDPDLYDEELYDLRHCRLRRATFSMEYVSFIFNVVIGFVCLLVGIFNYQDKSIPKSNLIGILCSILGFVLTIIYIIIGGILFIQYYPSTEILRRDSDGSVAENEGGKGFRCYYYSSKGDKTPFYAKYIDFIILMIWAFYTYRNIRINIFFFMIYICFFLMQKFKTRIA